MPEQIQKRASKLILVFRHLSYKEILKEYGLTTLHTRRFKGSNRSFVKILNGHENIHPNIFFFKINTGKKN